MTPEILKAEQVAELLGVKPSTVKDYARRKIIPGVKLGKHWRFIRGDVLAHFEKLSRESLDEDFVSDRKI